MKCHFLLFLLLLPWCTHQLGLCPSQSLFIGQAIISFDDTANRPDTTTYSVSLPSAFKSPPGVAIALQQFHAPGSLFLSFSIRFAISYTRLGQLFFVVRILQKYNTWNRISFSYLAQNFCSMQAAGYLMRMIFFIVETNNLTHPGGSQSLYIPITDSSEELTQSAVFLHGFEYTAAQPVSSCQILIGNVTSNATGVFFDVASDSSLNFIYISIFRCNSTKELIAFGTVQSFQKANTANLLLPLKHSVSMSTAQFYGLTSFDLVSSGKDILFTSSLDKVNNKFILKTNTAFKSVQYSYLLLLGSICNYCPNYPTYNTGTNTCDRPACAPRKILLALALTNVDCPSCPGGQKYNSITGRCGCPNTTYWNSFNNLCVTCRIDQIWDSENQKCQCPKDTIDYGDYCMSLTPSDDLPINRNPLYNPNPPPSQTYPANQIQIRLTQEAINVDNITSLKFNISYIPYNLAKTTVDITNTLNIIYVNGISLKTASQGSFINFISKSNELFVAIPTPNMEPFSLRVRINSTIAKLYYKTYDTSQSLLLNVNPLLISTQNIFYF